jgi:aspartyl-tRNA(Asn)/glutamyl-tRNA(Gln) amidotransferase subunit A
MMNVIAGQDVADSTSVGEEIAPVPDYFEGLDEPIEGLRIGVVPKFSGGADAEVQKALGDAIDVYKGLGGLLRNSYG